MGIHIASFQLGSNKESATSYATMHHLVQVNNPPMHHLGRVQEFGFLSIQPQRGLNTPIFLFAPQNPLPLLGHLNKVDASFL